MIPKCGFYLQHIQNDAMEMYTKKFTCTTEIPKLVLQVMNLVLQLVLRVILQVKPAEKKSYKVKKALYHSL